MRNFTQLATATLLSLSLSLTASIPTLDYRELLEGGPDFELRLAEAMKKGVFYLSQPEEEESASDAALNFAHTFFLNDDLCSGDYPGVTGYHARDYHQVESFYAEGSLFETVLPVEVTEHARTLEVMGQTILEAIQQHIDLPSEIWDEATCTGARLCHFTMNHYRSELEDREGHRPHKDFGLLSIFEQDSCTLEVSLNGEWETLSCTEGQYIVFLDQALELLVNDSDVLNACVKRVPSQNHDDAVNTSVALDATLDSPLWQYDYASQSLVMLNSCYELYLKECFEACYSE